MHTAAPFVVAVLTVALVALVAGAHDTDLTDPDDARGKLDVKQVRLAHQPGPPQWTIVTYGEWRTDSTNRPPSLSLRPNSARE